MTDGIRQALPQPLAALVGDKPWELAWTHESGVTVAVGTGDDRRFVKWWRADASLSDLTAEAERMRWAAGWAPVPEVLDVGSDDQGSWLVTAPLPGTNAVDDRWKADPAATVEQLGLALRWWHESGPVDACPFSWTVDDRLPVARRMVADGHRPPETWHEDHQHLSTDEALDIVADPPPVDRLVVCHGDTCAPNTLIDDDGQWVGFVDLGALGVADRWADLAIATWSAGWNYGLEWERPLLDAYGIDPDPDRTAYYRLLWDLGP